MPFAEYSLLQNRAVGGEKAVETLGEGVPVEIEHEARVVGLRYGFHLAESVFAGLRFAVFRLTGHLPCEFHGEEVREGGHGVAVHLPGADLGLA